MSLYCTFKTILITTLLFIVFACDTEKKEEGSRTTGGETNKPKGNANKAEVDVPDFNADSAYYFIERQVALGPRVPGTQEHMETGNYLIEQLEGFGARVQVQSFEAEAYDGTMLPLRNIFAAFYPEKTRRILLAAHWDTRPFADKDDEREREPIMGANDGGSGVGVLLEIARMLQESEPSVGVDIMLFDGEDYGQPQWDTDYSRKGETYCLGSQYWAENKMPRNYAAYYGILLDMVGAENARFGREYYSMQYAPTIVDKVWEKARELGYGSFFLQEQAGGITDDHYFVNQTGIPMIDIIEYHPQRDFGWYHHTHDDNMDIISRRTLEAVGETVSHVIWNEEGSK
ncbi:M28 family peptidase [Roseivirga sp. BDSF3-8]|uniref:M28 family peptidase n=1 Tax=Roseivirga sp. BDSF3-8 TaxID=3241598 RepID=UPI003531B366